MLLLIVCAIIGRPQIAERDGIRRGQATIVQRPVLNVAIVLQQWQQHLHTARPERIVVHVDRAQKRRRRKRRANERQCRQSSVRIERRNRGVHFQDCNVLNNRVLQLQCISTLTRIVIVIVIVSIRIRIRIVIVAVAVVFIVLL